jgi:Ca-activated chloride channel family protein
MHTAEMRLFAMTLTLALTAAPLMGEAQDQRPTFRAAVDRVTVAATVRDKRGRPVTTLKVEDFHLLDNGKPQQILEFARDKAPMSIALLADFSGSMDVAAKRGASRDVVEQMMAWLTTGEDRVGLYAFDQGLEEVQPLEPAPGHILEKMDRLEPWGKTRLFDAIAETGRRLAASGAGRRAVVVLTDGDDNASQLTPAEVSAVASSIDVPVYIIVIVSPLDRVGKTSTSVIDPQLAQHRDGALGDLARWTGGDIVLPVTSADASNATRQIVTELREQYLIAFEPRREPGWHPLELSTTKTNLVVRARSGYLVRSQPAPLNHHSTDSEPKTR